MDISENTLSILKNFADINAGILIEQGKKELKTKSIANNIFAKATIIEDFPVEVAIYDLNEFINVMSLFSEPDLDFRDEHVVITDKRNKRMKVEYRYAAKDLIAYPTKDVAMNDFDVNVDISKDSLSQFSKAANMLVVEDVSITNTVEPGIVTLKVLDTKNSSSNVFASNVGVSDVTAQFDFHFKAENMKIMSGDYALGLSSKLISKFTNKNMDLEYYIAIEASSSYTE